MVHLHAIVPQNSLENFAQKHPQPIAKLQVVRRMKCKFECRKLKFDANLFRCMADQSSSRFSCDVDYCATHSPCKNNSTCRPTKGGYLCECLLGYTGQTCEDDLNECEFSPCKNDGTCQNTLGSYKCECKPGFGGELCTEKIGFCLPNPCGDHGTCQDLDDSYRCECHTGYTGQHCETETPCTCENPSHQCTLVNGQPSCQCPPGMQGEHCDEPLDICAEKNECQNGGQCIANGNKTFCICPSRYSGHFCEHEIDEDCLVDGRKCENNGQCRHSSSSEAYCECLPNYSGKWCEVSNFLSTVHPGNITSRSCPTGFIGEQCDLECDCHPNEICRESIENPGRAECLRVSNGTDETSSSSPSPSTLTHVDINTTFETQKTTSTQPGTPFSSIRTSVTKLPITSMSTKFPFIPSIDFKNVTSCDECVHAQKCLKLDGRWQCICQLEYSGSVCDLPIQPCQKLRCANGQVCRLRRTRKGDVPFCGCPPGLSGLDCQTPTIATFKSSSIFIRQTSQMLPNLRSGSQTYSLELSFRTTVANVHFASGETILGQLQFSIGLSQGQLALNLSSNRIYGILDLPLNDADWYTIRFDGHSNGTTVEVIEATSGYLLAKRIFPRQPWGIYTTRVGKRDGGGYMVGCLRDVIVNQQNVDLFDPERSIDVVSGCERREQCAADTCQNSAKCIDLWSEFRCDCLRPFLAPDCLHQLQEATFGHENQSTMVKFSVSKEEASVVRQFTDLSFLVRTNAENGPIMYLGENGNDDVGTFLSVEVLNGKLKVNTRLGGKNVMSKASENKINDNTPHLVQIMRQNNDIKLSIDGKREFVLTLNWPFEHPLLMDSVVLGDSDSTRPEAFSSKTKYLKGTLQDIRLNGRSIILDDNPPDFDLEKFGQKISSTNLLRGTVSDNICASRRCQHGECRNTFNDYECLCEVGWMGRDCDERDYCSNSTCEDGTTCKNSHNGFVCVGTATFAPTSTIKYNIFLPERPWLTPKESNFTFEIRTRSSRGNVFKLQSSVESLWLELVDRKLIFGYNNVTSSMEDPLAFNLTDGKWHTIMVFMNSNSKLFATFDNFSTVPLLAPFSFTRFLMDKSSRITLGKSYNVTGFKGCLREVKLNTLPEFSFLRKDNFGGHLEETVHFIPESREHIRADGCHSTEICGRVNPCKNGARCLDLFELRKCECQPGFEGEFCEININDCDGFTACHPNGVCLDGLNEQSCVCKPGYSGSRCEQMEDQCSPNPCQNGANCKTIDGEFSCQCPVGFFGHRCQQRQDVDCAAKPCENGATCTDLTQNSILCSCTNGFRVMVELVRLDKMVAWFVNALSAMPARHVRNSWTRALPKNRVYMADVQTRGMDFFVSATKAGKDRIVISPWTFALIFHVITMVHALIRAPVFDANVPNISWV
uniref:Protein crumbs n=1 Tax=Acrobeloides nanus TaxID=290746 RepID=A0A914ED71_9BILA